MLNARVGGFLGGMKLPMTPIFNQETQGGHG